MTEADVENINGTSSNETLVKDAQSIDPKAGNLEAGDSDTKQDDNSDIAKPKDKDVAITDVKCDSPKPDNEDEDAQKDGEQTK
uniref:Uncharacterized protein n=1 Tax=Acrobeloides nanus TaxID=290746 RepID=A0A914DHM7_9BILA